jgi:hypothetical protein
MLDKKKGGEREGGKVNPRFTKSPFRLYAF